MGNVRKTALFNAHLRYGGEMIEFAGWELPVQYTDIIDEHQAVRKAAGLFDVSHMGEIEVNGADALDFLQYLVTNDLGVLDDNQVIYTLMCYPNGGVVDDLLVYKFDHEHLMLVVNASNVDKDYEWIVKNKISFNTEVNNISDQVSEVALQGPKAQQILQKITCDGLDGIKFFFSRRDVVIAGVKCLVSRTGYTGEDGFEIYATNREIERVWDSILEAGREEGIKPAGLGCRDTLRFEACLPLYGNEISESITPLEAGLDYFVKFNKKGFIGRDALIKQDGEGLKRKLTGFEMKDRGIPRHGYDVVADNEKVGFVTTGYYSPTLNKNIGLALVDSKYAGPGSKFKVVIRNKLLNAEAINKKFYKKNYKK